LDTYLSPPFSLSGKEKERKGQDRLLVGWAVSQPLLKCFKGAKSSFLLNKCFFTFLHAPVACWLYCINPPNSHQFIPLVQLYIATCVTASTFLWRFVWKRSISCLLTRASLPAAVSPSPQLLHSLRHFFTITHILEVSPSFQCQKESWTHQIHTWKAWA